MIKVIIPTFLDILINKSSVDNFISFDLFVTNDFASSFSEQSLQKNALEPSL